ncbi:spliceosome ATPase-activating subunit SPP2 SCDLUD_003263 [Saccharomycodes ludwigii]|uniref:spliceosome ATPase-activating subunit SPP2 n=1 Tax=Saccharomycodes ludwigii TaxID=36035 RepID=UPI001E81EE5C|nr:hypothetical protein SCDLUD_003263 [Saccharomycodes ludwigii]KAH3900291.1 hypothetical protein SCDLUD_003263 [Saccharomycodes ludwigii]
MERISINLKTAKKNNPKRNKNIIQRNNTLNSIDNKEEGNSFPCVKNEKISFDIDNESLKNDSDAFLNKRKRKRQKLISKISINEISKSKFSDDEQSSNKKEKITIKAPTEILNNEQKITSLQEYEKVPIKQFGIGILRGMGYDGNEVEDGGNVKQSKNMVTNSNNGSISTSDTIAKGQEYTGIGAKATDSTINKLHNHINNKDKGDERFFPLIKIPKL